MVRSHMYITIAIVIVLVIVVLISWYYSPAISSMVSGKKSFDVDEEELDHLIDSIHNKQKKFITQGTR